MRKYLATALFAVLPLGFFLANGSSEASARDRGFLSNLFSKRKATECEVPCAEPAKAQEPKKETPKPEVKPEPKKEMPKAEPKKETPKPEVKPEPKKETPKPEVKKETPKPEVKKEAPKNEPKKTVPASSSTPPAGFVNLFNGKDFGNWWGFGTSDPRKFKALPPAEQAKIKEANMKDILAHWKVEGNEIVNDGKGLYCVYYLFAQYLDVVAQISSIGGKI